jgi:hypothetical protein
MYFWNHEYRHELRTLKPHLQEEVKKSWLQYDLELDGVSDLHLELICCINGDYTIEGEAPEERLKRLEKSYH